MVQDFGPQDEARISKKQSDSSYTAVSRSQLRCFRIVGSDTFISSCEKKLVNIMVLYKNVFCLNNLVYVSYCHNSPIISKRQG